METTNPNKKNELSFKKASRMIQLIIGLIVIGAIYLQHKNLLKLFNWLIGS
jgi:uncharacterized membrane protein (Fun14 family)